YIKKIDELGGAPEAIAKGYIQKEIQDSAYAWQMDVENKRRIIVGVNQFVTEEEPPKDLLRVDGSVGKLQAEKIAALKAKRNQAEVDKTLAALEAGCKDEKVNLMPLILAAVEAYATEGEICGVMRKVFGEYKAPTL
ncbi:MAG: methylmalonyl-CoA mutase, partial [Phascolarctobacterium sp.]|nr:methylmalonyl-CoA mutase [Candidatus Phascolarctobacterium caballi]